MRWIWSSLPAVTSTADAPKPGSPRVWEDCPDNIAFVELVGDKAATDAAFARAVHVVKQRFVVNRVTAVLDGAAPRGRRLSRSRRALHAFLRQALQRPHPVRADLAKLFQASESKVRVVTGDTGGSLA